jgi:anti-sigma regulatory factor (Ser/Thr protein kinase)
MGAVMAPADGRATLEDDGWLDVHDASAAGAVRRRAAALGEAAGLRQSTLDDLAIVATEIGTNLGRHAVEGTVLIRICRLGEAAGIELVAVDRGPGMADVGGSVQDGRSTAGTLGIGLGAIARRARSLDIYSRSGIGTVLAATVGDVPLAAEAAVRRPIPGEQVCGDGYAWRWVHGRRQLMLCDGLGHGPLAGLAAQAALEQFRLAPEVGPREVLDHIHVRTRHTRGVVAAIAELDPDRRLVRFAGIGNIAASVVDGSSRRAMVSMPGILGQVHRDPREFDYPLAPDAVVVLHSDGLTDRWDLGTYPGLSAHSAVLIAATLLRDAGRRRDDAAVLVAKQ